MYNNFELKSDSNSNRALVSIDMSLVFVVRYHCQKSAITACRGKNTPHILYSATLEKVFDPTHKYHYATTTQTAYRAANINYWSVVESGPDLTTAHVVNSVKILRNSILLVTFHYMVFVYNHYSSCSHQSGLGTANLYFISPPTFLFNATPSAIFVTIACCIMGDGFPLTLLVQLVPKTRLGHTHFVGFVMSRLNLMPKQS